MNEEKDARTRLIEAALPLFATKGFKAVSIKEIAESAGVNSALINYYFKSKDGLYEAILESQFSKVSSLVLHSEWQLLEPIERVSHFLLSFTRLHRANPYIRRLMTSELNHPSPGFEYFAQKYLSKFKDLLIETLEAGIAKGQFRADLNPAYTVAIMFGMVNYYFVAEPLASKFIFKDKFEDDQDSFGKQAIEICLGGIMRPGYKAES